MSITWTASSDGLSAQAVCTTGTETATPTGTMGIYGGNISGIGIFVDAGAGNTIASGNLRCWVRNQATQVYAACADLDIAIPATAVRSRYFIATSAGPGLPVIDRESYYAWVPDTVTAAGGLTIYLRGTPGGRA